MFGSIIFYCIRQCWCAWIQFVYQFLQPINDLKFVLYWRVLQYVFIRVDLLVGEGEGGINQNIHREKTQDAFKIK